MKTVICLAASMLLVVLMLLGSNARAEQPAKAPVEAKPAVELDPVIAKLLKEDPKDDELRKLMKARCVGLAAMRKQLEPRVGAITQEDFTAQIIDLDRTTQRCLQGCLELADSSEDKLAVLTQFVQIAKDFEAKIEQRTSKGVGAPYILTRAQCNRMDMEIQLLRAKKEIDKAK